MATIRDRRLGAMAVTTCMLFLLLLSMLMAGCAATKASLDASVPPPEPEKPPLNPLTGEVVASWDLVTRRPLAVKVENDPAARPQSGIVDADLVYEELVEGGITRFVCVYLSKEPPAIGPDRSARPSDTDICYYLNPLFACSGGERTVVSMIQASGMNYIEEDATHFWRDRSRHAPHNLYTSDALLRQYLAETGDTYKGLPVSGLAFSGGEEEKEQPAGGEQVEESAGEAVEGSGEAAAGESVMWSPATTVNVPYKTAVCAASYQYDPASDSYLHLINGTPHTDLTTGARVAPRNVIVQYCTVTNSNLTDVTGSTVPVTQVIGGGKCLVFTGGKAFHATWRKDNRSSPTRFTDENGNLLPLKPGQTWIHLVSEDIGATYQ